MTRGPTDARADPVWRPELADSARRATSLTSRCRTTGPRRAAGGRAGDHCWRRGRAAHRRGTADAAEERRSASSGWTSRRCDAAAERVLSEVFGFHPIAVQDCVDPQPGAQGARLSGPRLRRPARPRTRHARPRALHRARPVRRAELRGHRARPDQPARSTRTSHPGRPGRCSTGSRRGTSGRTPRTSFRTPSSPLWRAIRRPTSRRSPWRCGSSSSRSPVVTSTIPGTSSTGCSGLATGCWWSARWVR